MNGVAEKVKLPAIGLLVTAAIGILGNCISIVMAIIGLAAGTAATAASKGPQDQQFQQMMAQFQGIPSIVFGIIGIAVAGFVIFASLKMMKVEGWTMSVVAA